MPNKYLLSNIKFYLGISILSLALVLFACKKLDFTRIIRIETGNISDIDNTTAKSEGILFDTGEQGIVQYGHCWSLNENPTISLNSKTMYGERVEGIQYTSTMNDLINDSTYYVRSYCYTDIENPIYGNQISFVKGHADGTSSAIDNKMPEVSTTAASSITSTSVITGGNVTSEGSSKVTTRGICWSTIQQPELSDNHNEEGSGTGEFSSTITGLNSKTTYYLRAYATNSGGTSYGNEIEFNTLSASAIGCPSEFTDIDGNVYHGVQIGDQCWMKENLKATKYSDGSDLTFGNDAINITGDYITKYYFNYDKSGGNADTYGRLYTWAAAMNTTSSSNANPSGVKGICPDGWHLPSDDEWKELELHLGLSQTDKDATEWRGTVEGGKMKEQGTSHWTDPNTGANNASGFTALPGGYRLSNGFYTNINTYGYWWSSTQNSVSKAWSRGLLNVNSSVYRSDFNKDNAFSVRCVKD